MQNWDTATMQQTTAASNNFLEHNTWYNQMFAANIKQEPGTVVSQPQHSPLNTASHLENYLKQHHQQFAESAAAAAAAQNSLPAMTPSPTNNTEFFETNSLQQQQQQQHHQHQLLQQQQYQQHFQQAQQAAAQNQISSHLPLGFNPLTPPGLPNAVLPAMSHHYYTQAQQRQQQQTPSPCLNENLEKAALTPRHTPPMDITPPKSPKMSNGNINPSNGNSMMMDHNQQGHEDQDLISNSSEDLKYIVESEDDESIRMPIYNSHGKMKNHKCKSCGMVAITKMAFWEHARTHMKPEKILQCPKCPFVTELKHHLEYHIRKHKNLKPFQCDKCSYSCVNKSMLNSHRKSHSSVYQYRCADCDYATKYCHSFKLHLRKYEHKPGMVLDEEGIPNPSVIIDVYGTRRGPKNKSSSGAAGLKKACSDLKIPPTSQLSAALQGFPLQQQQQTQSSASSSSMHSSQMPASPAKSNSSVVSDLPALTLNMSLQQQANMPPQSPGAGSSAQQQAANNQQQQLNNLLPPLASLLQQNRNMAFFPYWNLNLQMLAAQQQAAVLAQLSPRMREQLQQKQSENGSDFHQNSDDLNEEEEEECDEEEDQEEFDRKSVDSAMDLSQGTPTKEEQQTPDMAMNLKLSGEDHGDTPLFSSSAAVRRKGRVLKLDPEQMKSHQATSLPSSPQHASENPPTTSSPIQANGFAAPAQNKNEEHSSADESMEQANGPQNHHPTTTAANTSASSTASSSGNSSNSSSTSASNGSSSAATSPTTTNTTMYECKYCDIFFKDAVLYTIHMGYHSCDDVFKCNMCGEKCDGPVGLFVHMARNAHS
uniref:Protein hunchback n=1 Tax=Stomoxys calcitrans TaxID=35570 RepID=A0A1I8NPI0_STOCA